MWVEEEIPITGLKGGVRGTMVKASALSGLSVSQLEKVLLAKKSKLNDLVVKRDKLRLELATLDGQIQGLKGSDDLEDESGEEAAAPRRRGRDRKSVV